MLNKKWIAAALIAAAAISTTASASDRGVNTALGAVAGAVIGNSVGGQNAAIVGGVLGAVVGNSIGGRGDRNYSRRQSGYREAPVYYRQQPVRPVYRDPVYRDPVYRDRGGYYGSEYRGRGRYDYRDRSYERVDYGYNGYRR